MEERRALLTEKEYEQEGQRETKMALRELSDAEQTELPTLYMGELGKQQRRSSLAEIIMRGFVLVAILVAASSVFENGLKDERIIGGLKDVLGDVLPYMIGQVALWFSYPAAWAGLCLFAVVLLTLYCINERGHRLLRTSAIVQALYHGVILPILIVALFVLTFGAWVFLNLNSEVGKDVQNENGFVEGKAEVINRAIAGFCKIPVIGDVITSSTLVAVIPSVSLNTAAARPCANEFTALFAVYIFAATLFCFLGIVQMVLNKLSLRNVFFTLAVAVVCVVDATVSEFFPQFTCGFVIIIVLHMIRFLDAAFDIFSVSGAVRAASRIENDRYPDHDEMEKYLPPLNGISEVLKQSNNLVLYVGEEVTRAGGSSLSNLSLFQFEVMWKLFPGLAKKYYRNKLLASINAGRRTRGEAYVNKLLNNIQAFNGCNVTVITECVANRLQLPPQAGLIELRGNVSAMACKDGHVKAVPVADQVGNEKLMCDCGLELEPTVRIGKNVDADALGEALGAIDSLHAPSSAMLVLGTCDNSQLRGEMENKHANGEVPLMQISSGRKMNNVDFFVPATPGSVLFEIVDDLE